MKLFNAGKNRRSIRLKEYDYSKDGLYFVTISCSNNTLFFGEVVEGKMNLNSIGQIARDEWLRTTEIRNYVVLHEFIVMPNHVHMIIELRSEKQIQQTIVIQTSSKTIGSIVRGYKIAVIKKIKQEANKHVIQRKKENDIEDKTPWPRIQACAYKIGHRNYYKCIIRDERAYNNISKYIRDNPKNW